MKRQNQQDKYKWLNSQYSEENRMNTIAIKKYCRAALITAALASTSALATDASFNATMQLLSAISVTNTQGLSFADTAAGGNINITTTPTDANAATFTATGEANTAVTGSITTANITMQTGGGGSADKEINVTWFAFGGDMDAAGAATFDGAGALNNLRVGGTAQVESDDIAGAYSGTGTFRLVYQ